MKKTIIDIKGVITKNNKQDFTEDEYEQFVDEFLELVNRKGLGFGGGFAHVTEDEWDKFNP